MANEEKLEQDNFDKDIKEVSKETEELQEKLDEIKAKTEIDGFPVYSVLKIHDKEMKVQANEFGLYIPIVISVDKSTHPVYIHISKEILKKCLE